MSLIKDFLRRREIDARAQSLVTNHLTDLVMKRITDSNNDKKVQRKLDKASQQLKNHATMIIVEMKLGLYGKPRFLKSLQDSMFDLKLDDNFVNKIIKSLA